MGKKTTSTDYHLAEHLLDEEERAFRTKMVETTYQVLKANKVRPPKRVKHLSQLYVDGLISDNELNALLNARVSK
ncbi:hypothetical protein [Xanthomonas campestris]|uniref:hypothetical protein n=1 Tax=Xanthomonas TaxID=338 RepID=UPI001AF15C79|nr:hypothetical protein [Xanthomonas campestris]CAD7738105.1 hypothetical protein LMG31885_27870 [Xanthomonas hydrangeae]MBV6813694.1 hypothetical protein [Xanthomonas campestris pv. passiflorae]CAD7738108.1 hypothetical protein LMG31885_27870 [Xanthomonas hydrangeae]CAD7741672.1 hypothetical protein LMG31886_32530 [Xanthomonas hydrangeae]CAD7741676.1 hypothetical protein LMG31886_32530 [Xanthomonas hydrangeae]